MNKNLFVPTCPAGADNCVCDPAYIKLRNPKWYGQLFGNLTPVIHLKHGMYSP